MLPETLTGPWSQLAGRVRRGELELERVRSHWRGAGGRTGSAKAPLEPADAALADGVSRALRQATQDEAQIDALGAWFDGPERALLVAWCEASTARRDVWLARLLHLAKSTSLRDKVRVLGRARVVEGPLLDALACVPLLGAGDELLSDENREALARTEILLWEAGAVALELPHLGGWLWKSAATFDVVVKRPARGSLFGRSLAARALEAAAAGLRKTTPPELVSETLQTLQPLLLHPEPTVWVHAARALGRLTGAFEPLEGTLLDWVDGSSQVLRQRAITAFACLPSERLVFLGSRLAQLVDSRDPNEAPAILEAVAHATPYLYAERRALWERLYRRVLAGDGGPGAARALARGLAALWRRGYDAELEAKLRTLRDKARAERPTELGALRAWIDVVSATDAIDGAERDPLDLELGLENLVRVAAQYDDEEADARAARFALAIAPTFEEARRLALASSRPRERAAAIGALEACARALALHLWTPIVAMSAVGTQVDPPDVEPARRVVGEAPAALLELAAARRAGQKDDAGLAEHLEILAVRLGGLVLDGYSTDHERGAVARAICGWLRTIEGLVDGSRQLSAPLMEALSALFWRLVDSTRGTALGEHDDVLWLAPFVAWWSLVVDRPSVLLPLGHALPLVATGALSTCCERGEVLRDALLKAKSDGRFRDEARAALASLHVEGTVLARSLDALADALDGFAAAAGPQASLEASCLVLVRAGERLHAALANPVVALRPADPNAVDEPLDATEADNAPRVAALVTRAIRARDLSLVEVWIASLGPVVAPLVEASVRAAVKRTPPPPPVRRVQATSFEGYELVKPLGEGGVGTVWLVRKPGADRLFVLKTPKADVLAAASEVERAGVLASFVEEAKALAGLYHPNVANIVDRGVSNGVPFLVLDRLIGADLKVYAQARPMTLFELRPIVRDVCAGLTALHGAGLIHRDIKPANVWLRLPLKLDERFDPDKHRDPATTPPLAAVLIDFGMVRSARIAPEAAGRFVAGTMGYIAPEQVLDPIELDPRADVYSLAGTVYAAVTGRSFFDDVEGQRDRILRHMQKDPFEDAERLRPFPAALAKLLRQAVAHAPAERPTPLEFERDFTAAI